MLMPCSFSISSNGETHAQNPITDHHFWNQLLCKETIHLSVVFVLRCSSKGWDAKVHQVTNPVRNVRGKQSWWVAYIPQSFPSGGTDTKEPQTGWWHQSHVPKSQCTCAPSASSTQSFCLVQHSTCFLKYFCTVDYVPRSIYQPHQGNQWVKGSDKHIKGGANCLPMKRRWQQVVISSPASQGCLRSSLTKLMYPQLHHSTTGVELPTCSLSIISSKSSMTPEYLCIMACSWVNTSYLISSEHLTELPRKRYTVPTPMT